MSLGLWSKVSTCETPPLMHMKITRLALAGKWPGLGAKGLSGLDCAINWLMIPGSNADPPTRDRMKCRRSNCCGSGIARFSPRLFDKQEFVRAKQRLDECRHGLLLRFGIGAALGSIHVLRLGQESLRPILVARTGRAIVNRPEDTVEPGV